MYCFGPFLHKASAERAANHGPLQPALEELKGHCGQSGKLDKIMEEINLYGKVYDEDLHICSDFTNKNIYRERGERESDLDDKG